jgi:hypothetical protein
VAEPIDIYADGYGIVYGPWGSNIAFSLSDGQPAQPGNLVNPTKLAIIRMSPEMLKCLAIGLVRGIKNFERAMGVSTPMPQNILNQMGISADDWESFWRRDELPPL